MLTSRLSARAGRVALSAWFVTAGIVLAISTPAAGQIHLAQESAAQATTSPIDLALSAGDGAFDVDEPVVLTASVTNRAEGDCALVESPETTLQIMRVTRNGKVVTPSFGLVSYTDGIGQMLRRTWREVPVGSSLSFPLVERLSADGTESGLQAVAPRRGDGGVVSTWPVAEPGLYELEAAYAVPNVADAEIERCTGRSNVASIEFRIGPTPAAESAGTNRLPFLLIAFAVVLVVALIVVLMLRRRRAAASVVTMLIVGALLASPMATGRAHAKVVPELGGANDEVRACLDDLTRLDPAGIMPLLNGPELDPGVRIVGTMDSRSALFNQDEHPYFDEGIGDTSSLGATVRFDWTVGESGFEFEDGVAWDNCAALYHELVHVFLYVNDETGDDECKNAAIKVDEFKAIVGENAYRRSVGLPERTEYDGVTIPDICEDSVEPEDEDEGSEDGGEKGDPGGDDGGEGERAGGSGGDGAGGGGSGEGESGGGSGSGAGGGGAGGGEGESGGGSGSGTGGDGAGGGAGEAAGGGGEPSGGAGGSNGDPHLVTLDGFYYDFQAVGEFVLVTSEAGDLQVQARQAPYADSRSVSVNSAIAVQLVGTQLSFQIDERSDIAVRRDGAPAVPEERGTVDLGEGASLTRRGSPDDAYGVDGYTLVWPDGSTVWIDAISMSAGYGLRVYVELAEDRAGTVSGLLGDFDGDPGNDLTDRDGGAVELDGPGQPALESLYEQFGDSWRISADESLFDYGEGESTDTFTDREFPDQEASAGSLSAEARSDAEAICNDLGVTHPALLDACILDVATTGQAAYAVNTDEAQRVVSGSAEPVAVNPGPSQTPQETPEPGTPPTTAGDDLAPGDTIDGRLDEPGSIVVHRFSAKAGDIAYFEADPDCEFEGTQLGWGVQFLANVGTPYGALNGQASICSDMGRTRFPEDGEYAVVISGGPENDTGSYQFTWLSTPRDSSKPLELGEQIEGQLEPGERHGYVFDAVGGETFSYLADNPCTGSLTYELMPAEQFEAGYTAGADGYVCDDQREITLDTSRWALVITRYTPDESADYSFVFE